MGQRIKHPVLGEIEQIQTAELPTLSTYTIELIEVGVMLSLLFFILYKFKEKALQEPVRKSVFQSERVKANQPKEVAITLVGSKS